MPAISSPQPTLRPIIRKEELSIELGKRIKALRIAANRSQVELAFDCELDRTYISLVERGIANPSLWTLGTLAYALNVTVPDLFQGNRNVVRPSMGASDRKRRATQASHEGKSVVGSRRSQLR